MLSIAGDSAVVIPIELIHHGVPGTAPRAASRGFAEKAAGTGVTVDAVIAGPGPTGGLEDFVRSLVGDEPARQEAQREPVRRHRPRSLIRRPVEPEEIAHMVIHLASPPASATTGGALRADGGHVDGILP